MGNDAVDSCGCPHYIEYSHDKERRTIACDIKVESSGTYDCYDRLVELDGRPMLIDSLIVTLENLSMEKTNGILEAIVEKMEK